MHKMIMQTDRNEVRKLNTFKLETDHNMWRCVKVMSNGKFKFDRKSRKSSVKLGQDIRRFL